MEAERHIDDLREDIHELSIEQSELEQRVTKLIENARVILKRAIEEFKASEAFKDEVTEGALDMFLQGFDGCLK